MPKGIYKRLRDDTQKTPNPVLVTRKGAVQTSAQIKARLLCWDCEQRLCKFGEDRVLRNCLQQDGTFPLLSLLYSITPDLSAPTKSTKLYYASKVPEIDIFALAYFAVSIFWRASIHTWNHDGTFPISLGPYQEQLRQYLMGMHGFPKNCSLMVTVREAKEIDRLTYGPVGKRAGMFHVYKFPMPGFGFIFAVGQSIGREHTDLCFMRAPNNPIMVTDILEPWLLQDAHRLMSHHNTCAAIPGPVHG